MLNHKLRVSMTQPQSAPLAKAKGAEAKPQGVSADIPRATGMDRAITLIAHIPFIGMLAKAKFGLTPVTINVTRQGKTFAMTTYKRIGGQGNAPAPSGTPAHPAEGGNEATNHPAHAIGEKTTPNEKGLHDAKAAADTGAQGGSSAGAKSEAVVPKARSYNVQYGIGKSKYVVNFHDGEKKHKDGSPMFDMKIFHNKDDLNKFTSELSIKGYKNEHPALAAGKAIDASVKDLNDAVAAAKTGVPAGSQTGGKPAQPGMKHVGKDVNGADKGAAESPTRADDPNSEAPGEIGSWMKTSRKKWISGDATITGILPQSGLHLRVVKHPGGAYHAIIHGEHNPKHDAYTTSDVAYMSSKMFSSTDAARRWGMMQRKSHEKMKPYMTKK